MEINIEDYLGHEEIRDIAKDSIRSAINRDTERVISNMCYEISMKQVNDLIGDEHYQAIKKKIPELISKLSEFTVFKKKNAWDSHESEGYKLLQKAIAESDRDIKKRISDIVRNYNYEKFFEESLGDIVIDFIKHRLVEGKK